MKRIFFLLILVFAGFSLENGRAAADAPQDHFLGANLLAIVVQLDKSILTAGGPLVSVWAATHVSP